MSQYTIHFDNVEIAEANRYAAELREVLLDASPDIQVRQERDGSNTQDFGGTLVLVLGTPAVLAVAQGIKSWLEKRNSVKITIKQDGTLSGENLTSADAVKIIEKAFSR